MKICTKCKKSKDLEEFKKKTNTCKTCVNKYNREKYKENKIRYQGYSKTYYDNNQDNCLEKRKEYRENNQELIQSINSKYYMDNKDKENKRSIDKYYKDYDKNKELSKERARQRRKLIIEDRLKSGIKEGDHLLYILEISNENESFYKIGRTKYTIEERYKNLRYSEYKMNKIFELYADKEYIKALERKLLNITKEDYIRPLKFREHTECRSKLNDIMIEYIKENYDHQI